MDAFSEPEAFRLFVEANFRGLASLAQSILGSSFEAEDVAQEALILLYRSRARLRPDVSPRPLAYRIAQRLCFSRMRRERRRRAIATLLAPLAARESPPPADSVESWFRGLPRRQRAIAHLYFAENRDAGEIADLMGIAASTVRVQLGRIRSKLSASNPVPVESERCPHAS